MTAPARWRRSYRANLVEEIPCGVVVIDRSHTIVDHNRAFAEMFGESRGKPCFLATRDRKEQCAACPADRTFADGEPRVIEQNGTDRQGRPAHYLVQLTPVREGDRVEFVAATTTDLTATRRLQSEYQTLFEQVPCFVAVLNREYRVVKANRMFRRVFGEPTGEHCYTLFKRRQSKCEDCPAERTFADGATHTSRHVGMSRTGENTHYMVSTAALLPGDDGPSHVIEMALDLSELHLLERELDQAGRLREALVEGSLDAIIVLDETGRVKLLNHAAERLTGLSRHSAHDHELPLDRFPAQVGDLIAGTTSSCELQAVTITGPDGEALPVRLSGVLLHDDAKAVGSAFIIQDLRELTRLEREKLEAERLAAVGQTVAGLAHGIKNILTGLEGGMYVTSTGLKRSDPQRTKQGWEMLERNIGRISTLVRNLLAFSRGEGPKLTILDPLDVVREIYALFKESAAQHGVELRLDAVARPLDPVVMDHEGLRSCLENLVSNALDACLVSGSVPCTITLRVVERDRTVMFEVADSGCGMDYDVKQKVFTSFFSTKGAGGTGLGLLLTRKIVQQHGGSITFESTPGSGTTFRLSFPRDRLPQLAKTGGNAGPGEDKQKTRR